jgi:hypothetical protein
VASGKASRSTNNSERHYIFELHAPVIAVAQPTINDWVRRNSYRLLDAKQKHPRNLNTTLLGLRENL